MDKDCTVLGGVGVRWGGGAEGGDAITRGANVLGAKRAYTGLVLPTTRGRS